MATFIQGVTDTNLDPVLFTPDYSFLRYTIGKKNAQYEQGLKQVSSAYGNLKKELSDPTNVERRDNYLKAAESQLQQIASSDLSLQQNVNAANAIFDPIATDKAIAFDSYYTEKNRRERAEMETWAESDDPAVRKKFNQEIYNWLGRDLDAIRNGNGDINNYRKVQGRKAWAYVDAQDIITKAAKERGFEVKRDDLGQPYIVTTSGGAGFAPNYKAFANSVLDADPVYQRQTAILSQAKIETEIEKQRSVNPNLTREQALTQYYDQNYDLNRTRESEYLKSLNSDLATKTAEYQAYVKANAAKIDIAGSPERQKADQLWANLSSFQGHLANLQTNFETDYGNETNKAQKKEEFRKKFMESPEGYFMNKIKSDDAIRYSNIQSSFGTTSIKVDQGYIGLLNVRDRMRNTLNNIQDDQFDNNMDVSEFGEKQREFDIRYGGGKIGQGIGTGLSGRRKKADGTTGKPDIQYIGASATDLKTLTKIDQLKDQVAIVSANAISNLSEGINILESMGMNPSQVSAIRGYLQRKSLNSSTEGTPEEVEALKAAQTTLTEWSKIDENKNQELLKNLRQNQGASVDSMDFPKLLIMAAKNYPVESNMSASAIRGLREYETNQGVLNSMNNALTIATNAVIEKIKDDKDFSDVVIKEGGKARLLEATDIEKNMPLSGWKDGNSWFGSNNISITPLEAKAISEGIYNGTINAKVSSFLRTGGRSGEGAGFVTRTIIDYDGRELTIETPSAFTPSTKDLRSQLKRVNEKVPVPIFDESNEARVYANPLFELDGEFKDQSLLMLKQPTQANANMFTNPSGQLNAYEQVEPEKQLKVRSALADPKNVASVVLETSTSIPGGSQAIKVTFAPAKSKEDTSNPAAGETVYFPIDPYKAPAPFFKSLAGVSDASEFMQHSKKNEPMLLDHFESSGVKAIIYPTAPGAKTASVRLMYKYDPKSQTYTDTWQQVGEPFTVDFSQNTVEEVKQEINTKFIDPFVQRRMEYNKQQLGKQTPAGGTSYSSQSLNRVTW